MMTDLDRIARHLGRGMAQMEGRAGRLEIKVVPNSPCIGSVLVRWRSVNRYHNGVKKGEWESKILDTPGQRAAFMEGLAMNPNEEME